MRKVLIMVAPNGARRTKADNPALPITPAELAREAAACEAAGAAAIHLHVRDGAGAHTLSAARYAEAIAAVRAATSRDFVIQITTEAVGRFTPPEQVDCVMEVRPEAVSVALREILAEGTAADLGRLSAFFRWMADHAVAPQIILYDASDLVRLIDLLDRQVLPAKPFVLFVLGRYARDQQSDPTDLDPFLQVLGDRDLPWATCAFGKREAECLAAAAGRGGHVRVGFENNLLLPDGNPARSNAELVAVVAGLIRQEGREPMTAREARAFLGLAGA